MASIVAACSRALGESMTAYGSGERALARMLSHFPRVKALLKRAYEHAMYMQHRKDALYYCEYTLTEFGHPTAESFFGYYDKAPISPDGRHLLWHESVAPTSSPPDPARPISIVIASADGEERHRLVSWSYNWQQGARLHWVDADRVVFNDFDHDSKRYIARMVDPEGETGRTFSVPLVDTHGDVGVGISLDFRRLATLRPDYGYFNLPQYTRAELRGCPDDDGLWIVDLNDGRTHLAVSLHSLAAQTDPAALHKVNHPMISPHGGKCIFLHRYSNGGRRTDRLMVLDLVNGGVEELSAAGMVSHMAWRNEEELFGYLRGPDGRDGFFLVSAATGSMREVSPGVADYYGDGHPSLCGEGVVVYDSYPDKSRMQHLVSLKLDGDESRIEELGSFFHALKYRGVCRCDLHPRFGRDSREVYFDSVFSGRRRLWRLETEQRTQADDAGAFALQASHRASFLNQQ